MTQTGATEGGADGEGGAFRREKKPSFKRRLNGWNYRGRAIYAIIIELKNRRELVLGRLQPGLVAAVKAAGGCGKGEWEELWRTRQSTEPRTRQSTEPRTRQSTEPRTRQSTEPRTRQSAEPRGRVQRGVELTALGGEVVDIWAGLGERWPGIVPIDCQAMGDHFHGVIYFKTPQKKTLGAIIGAFKSMTASRAKALLGEGFELWAEGYVDKVILRRGQLGGELEYLRDNPRRRAVKAAFPELFRVVGELEVPLWRTRQSAEQRPGAEAGGGEGTESSAKARAPWGVGRFSALGNRFLLDRPLAQAQVSRSFFRYRRDEHDRIERGADGSPVVALSTPAFTETRDELFALARHGVAIISPCVSDGEREIARQALDARLPLVTLRNKGFSPLQKPSGRYFEACSDGRLLMLAPAAWPYQPGEKRMTRFDATALNRLAQWIAGDGAAEINYHGMKPANIDSLAIAAVKIRS